MADPVSWVNPSPPRCLGRSGRREADEDQEKGGSGKRIRQSSLLFLPADITHFLPLLLPQEYIVCILFPNPEFFQTVPLKPEKTRVCVSHTGSGLEAGPTISWGGGGFRVTQTSRGNCAVSAQVHHR